MRTTYTGHEFDEELGLTNMRGRIYDQKIGRFLEADPVVQAPYSTQVEATARTTTPPTPSRQRLWPQATYD